MNTPKRLDLTPAELDALLERVQAGTLAAGDYETIKAMVDTLTFLSRALDDKAASIKRLLRLLFGPRTEKREQLAKTLDNDANNPASNGGEASKRKRKGHGRNGAAHYRGAKTIPVSHESLQSGTVCPQCNTGKVYDLLPGTLVRVTGQAPLQASVYQLHKLRCNLCGETFTAATPEGVGEQKYDAPAASIIALLKYGTGLPFNRLEKLQHSFGVPVPASTQWDIIEAAAKKIEPAYDALVHHAAQGEVVYNDDTNMKILELMGKRRERSERSGLASPQRTGMFTSGIVSTVGPQRMALYFSGTNHAGENLQAVLARRRTELGPPIQMCDALSRNMPKELQSLLANCLAHGRRQFVDVLENFPHQCHHVLEALGKVYQNDAVAKEHAMDSQQRLRFHQDHSQPLMEKLHQWLNEQLEQKLVEPNSGLGQAMSYLLNHWTALTLFLRVPGAPLDNNLCERALKKAILHRKNALFFKTCYGARVGDLYMSLIHTCELCGVNPLDYLTELQRHAQPLRENPPQWMPWNYRDTLQSTSTADTSRAPR